MRLIRSLALAALVAMAASFAAAPALATCTSTTLSVIDAASATQQTAAQNCSGVIHPTNVVEAVDGSGNFHFFLVDGSGNLQTKVANFPGAVDTGAGASSANTIRFEPTSNAAADGGYAKEAGGVLAGQKTDLDTLVAHSPTLNGDGGVPVHLNNSGYPTDALTTGSINSATGSAAFTVNLANGEGVVAFAVSGLTASGATLTLEGSNDGGTTWSAISEIASSSSAPVSTLTADGQFRVGTGGRTKVRLRVSATGTGTITVAANASTQAGVISLLTPLPSGNKGLAGADGWDAAEGATADSACSTDTGTCPEIDLLKRLNQRITSLITALGSPLQAGGSTLFGRRAVVQFAPSVAQASYAAGNALGTTIAVDLSAEGCSTTQAVRIEGVSLMTTATSISAEGNTGVLFFSSTPSTTFTDGSTPTYSTSDRAKFMFFGLGTSNIALGTGAGLVTNQTVASDVLCDGTGKVYLQLIAGGAFTFTGTLAITGELNVLY